MAEPTPGQSVGRYVLYDAIASGGMASVHMGRLIGPVGFSRVVAIKRLHPAYAQDPGFVAMLLDEAQLASRVRHPNVVPILDVVATNDELLLVMEYVQGETLARLLRAAKRLGESMEPDVASSIVIDILRGLHAAHEARGTAGEPLGIVHRDVSPQNILVATDGSARLLDFGVAKAISRSQSTDDGQLKGKLGYIAPEQISGGEVDRRVDIFATSIVAWECIAGRRLFVADDMVATLARIMDAEVPPLRGAGFDIPEALEAAIARGLTVDPALRFQNAEDMAREVEAALRPASRERVSEWVAHLAGEALSQRLETMRRVETADSELGVVQVPVGISPDQSGKLPTLRTSVAGEEPATTDAGTFPATLATQSIVPPAEPSKGWRRGALFVLVAAALGALVTAGLMGRRGVTGGPSGSAEPQPVATRVAPADPEPTVAAQPAASASSSSRPEPAPSASSVDASGLADAASSGAPPPPTPPHPTRRTTKTSSKQPASGSKPPAGGPDTPTTPPVDPLLDQR